MRISVVIPAFNEEAYLPRTLEALRRQRRPADEVIVVDNGSSDQTAALARAWGARVVRCDTPGVAYARQAGLEAARFEWVASTDADSEPAEDWLEQLEAHAQGMVALYGPLQLTGVPYPTVWLASVVYGLFLAVCRAAGRPNLAGANMAFRRDAALAAGGYPPVEAREDVLLGYRLQKAGPVRFVPTARVRTSGRKLASGALPFLWRQVRSLFGRTRGYFAPRDGSPG
ncbi:glycosyltransferase involved in cell wall biosynthesis [Deinobacterium chartae]|uniref:Glycosyltransferase involved in cell wall biosynthesis n=1 Tax=Deinobacterium chartae TaxID=521158 RepID=A0A841I427_9DEIO|nr:glycosyltransferase family A protein [Deinobacterium chartae]MBB6099786.1 glycosyltransferase involved in cell wall biosynthesis [Deinobacterium chartae]